MSAPWVGGGGVAPRVLERHLAEALLAGARDAAASRVVRRCERVWKRASETLGPAAGAQAVWFHLVEPCAAAFDWPVTEPDAYDLGGLRACAAVPSAGLDDSVIVAVPWGVQTRALHRPLVRLAMERRRSWVSVCNGRSWAWYDARRPYAREHLAFDLGQAVADARVWQALWLLGQSCPRHRSRVDTTHWLERLLADSRNEDATTRAALRSRVATAMATLASIDRGTHDDHVRQVFQWIFLLCAEARALVPSWHGPYRRSYAVSTLVHGGAATGRAGPEILESVRAIARLGREGARLGGVDVAALNGRLFEPTSLTRRAGAVASAGLGEAIGRLAGTRSMSDDPAVDFGHLGVEHLGALYEHLIADTTATAGSVPVLRRKRSGAFYTPRSLADLVVQRTLAPLVDSASADDILALRVLDPAMGSGALLASALRYLVHAVEAAWVREGRSGPLDVPREMRDTLARRITEQCLFGVDLDATAVQVARMSLWLLSTVPDRPLTWLDAHLRVGNSLIGTSPGTILARAPVQGRRGRRTDGQLTLFELAQWHHEAGELGPLLEALAARPTDASADAHDKADAFARLRCRESVTRWRARADAWCGAAMDGTPPATAHWRVVDEQLRDGPVGVDGTVAAHRGARWRATAAAHRCFHWGLEFPDVFDAGRGGFDAVLANPPWEMLRGDLGTDGERAAARGDLAPLLRFVKRSGTYRRVGGHVNAYQLFVERMLQLVRPGGRLGCLVPGAVLADHGAANLRRHLLDHVAVDRVSIIDNREGFFPIHRSMRIVAITGTTGATTAGFVIDEGFPSSRRPRRAAPRPARSTDVRVPQSPADLRVLSRSLLRELGPSEAIPDVRHAHDLRILDALAALPSLDGPVWQLRFGRELNATEDAACLRRLPERDGLLVVDGKHLTAFAVRPPREGRWIGLADARERLAQRPWLRWRLAYRDVSSPTNARSLLAALLPPGCVSTHTIFCLRSPMALRMQLYLCGMLNSLVADWFVRRFLGAHITTRLMGSVRVPVPSWADPRVRRIARLAVTLTRAPDSEPAQAHLHATAADLYGLGSEDLAHICDDFPRLPDAVRAPLLAP